MSPRLPPLFAGSALPVVDLRGRRARRAIRKIARAIRHHELGAGYSPGNGEPSL
jgi:hypothetical protein